MKPTKEEIEIVRKIEETEGKCNDVDICINCPMGPDVCYSDREALQRAEAFLKKYDKKKKPYQKVNLGKRPEGELYLDDIKNADHVGFVGNDGEKYHTICANNKYYCLRNDKNYPDHFEWFESVQLLLGYYKPMITRLRRYEDRKDLYRWLSK